MSGCQIWFGSAASTRPHSFFLRARRRRERTSNPRSLITRWTRLGFSRRFSFLRNPPSHAAISIRGFFPARHDGLFVVLPIGPATSRLLSVVETRSADSQSRRYPRGRVTLRHHLPRLGVNRTTAHSPTTFFRISVSSDFRPSVLSNCRMRWSFSVSAAAALLPPHPQAPPSLLVLPHPSSDRTDWERFPDADTSPRRSRS
jgi:hypothetical protein